MYIKHIQIVNLSFHVLVVDFVKFHTCKINLKTANILAGKMF